MSGRRDAWTEQQTADLETNWPLHITMATVARRVGRDTSSCWHKARQLGLPPRERRSTPLNPPDKVVQIIQQGYEGGVSVKVIISQIYESVGMEYNTAQVSGTATRLGFKHRRQSGRIKPQQAVIIDVAIEPPQGGRSGCVWVMRPPTSLTDPVIYCGADTDGAWCASHHALALHPPPTDL